MWVIGPYFEWMVVGEESFWVGVGYFEGGGIEFGGTLF